MSDDSLEMLTEPPTGPGAASDRTLGSVPARIGPYRVDGLLGRGGMGEVYRAYDEGLQRAIAVKRIAAPHRTHVDARARFWREARALAALDHPGIVRVHRIDESDAGDLYLAMELVDGAPLSAALGNAWPSNAVAAVGRQAAEALAAAHRVGMTHRDVKPANLLLQSDGAVRVVDFGLARRASAMEERVTATGARVGTPAYMAPEQIDGREIGPPTDVFALGVVLYRALAGQHPFARDSAEATALAVTATRCAPLQSVTPMADPTLAAVVMRCLAQRPEDRYPDGAALAAALTPIPAMTPSELAAFIIEQQAVEPALSSSARVAPSLTPPSGAHPIAPQPIAPQPRPPIAMWLKLGVGALVIALAVWLGLRAPTVVEPPPPTAAPAPLPALPPRPVVAVTGFEAADDDPADPRAAVLADAVRVTLAQAPEGLVSVPWLALAHGLGPDETVDARIDPARLTRPGGRLGNVDLVIRGTLTDADGQLEITIELVSTRTLAVLRTWSMSGPADAVASGEIVARAVAQVLGVTLPDRLRLPTRSVSAWGAVLAERLALRRGEFEIAERNLEWALQLDPKATTARIDELALLRSRRQIDVLQTRAKALLARTDLTAHDRLLVQAWQARGHNDGAKAVRALDALLDQWPYDVGAYELLMALRAYDDTMRDPDALEQLARAVLAIAPRHETAASRLVRKLNADGRIEDAEALLVDIGVPRGTPSFLEIWAELDLYQNRLDQALTGFRAALRRSPDDIYSTHMALATQILLGKCGEAAVDALSRIQRVEATGKNSNLDWTYSLAAQALICRAQWPALDTLLTQWAAHSKSGRDQAAPLRHRVAILQGVPVVQIADALESQLDGPDMPTGAHHDLLRVLARVSVDADDLTKRAQVAEGIAMQPETAAPIRRAWLHTRRLLMLRAQLLTDPKAALAAIAALNAPSQRDAAGEADFAHRMEALAFEAEALAFAGRPDDAKPLWTRIETTGFGRLYVTDLWLLATRILTPSTVTPQRAP